MMGGICLPTRIECALRAACKPTRKQPPQDHEPESQARAHRKKQKRVGRDCSTHHGNDEGRKPADDEEEGKEGTDREPHSQNSPLLPKTLQSEKQHERERRATQHDGKVPPRYWWLRE